MQCEVPGQEEKTTLASGGFQYTDMREPLTGAERGTPWAKDRAPLACLAPTRGTNSRQASERLFGGASARGIAAIATGTVWE